MLAVVTSLFLAAAGGGSSGFGGGGGGGGGFSGGGGGFSGGGGYAGGGSAIGFVFIVLIIFVFVLITAVSGWLARRRYNRKKAERLLAVRRASAEASEDDAYFAADVVQKEAEALFVSVQQAWDARDLDTLHTLAGPDLLEEWRLRLADFESKGWHNRVEVLTDPKVEYIGLVNREDDTQDRVVCRIEAILRDYCQDANGAKIMHNGTQSDRSALCEYWTLGRSGDRWILMSIEQRTEGDHNLDETIVASPWSDTQRLTDESIVETAATAKAREGFTTADLVDPDFAADAQKAALDLSLADARFSPDVVAAAVRRAVAGWVEAVDGPDDALGSIATPGAMKALLHPGDDGEPPRTRLVVRGATVERIAIEALEPSPEPATLTVTVTCRGARYIEDRDTAAVLSGSKSSETRFSERWVLALEGDDRTPWRLVATSGAVAAAS
jgi:predicted lipid-binding transport protein (Tim44 family)